MNYVITGAPSSGKTTLISALRGRGYDVVEEMARVCIHRGLSQGKTIVDLHKDEAKFQNDIIVMQIEAERNVPKDRIVFLDRGMPDSWAYYRLHSLPDNQFFLKAVKNTSYTKVFILDPLPYQADYARIEKSEEEQIKLHELLHKAYEFFNIEIVKVPVLPVEERMEFILRNL